MVFQISNLLLSALLLSSGALSATIPHHHHRHHYLQKNENLHQGLKNDSNIPHFSARMISSATLTPQPFDEGSEKKIKGPGFVTVFPSHAQESSDENKKFDLFISTFKMFGKDNLYHVQDIGSKLNSFSSLQVSTVPSTAKIPLNWPNQLSQTPVELFGEKGVLVAGGFLPPGKNNGGIWYAPYNQDGSLGALKNIVFTKGWFYHATAVFDVNGDGQLDILSCRAKKPALPFVPTGGKLVWLEREKGLTDKWIERELADGCDVYFELVDLDGDGKMEIIATDFFTNHQITLFWANNTKNDFTTGLQSRVIDNTIGSPFDVRFVDLNGDGQKDLLATNHAKKGETPSGSVFAYETPSDWKTGEWKRRTLTQDIPVRQSGPFEAAPGTAQTFFPSVSAKNTLKKPYIMVAGDGSQEAFYLVPKSDSDPNNWEYDSKLLYNCQSVVGGIAIEDVDQDGFVEVFVPCYYSGKVNVFTFRPSK